jgi:membrane fusion protein (multidrug efflux system)
MNKYETVAKKPSRQRMITVGAIVAGVAILLFALVFAAPIAAFFGMGGAAQFAQPPATVSTTIARFEDWNPQQEAVGSLSAINGADLSFEVAGVIDAIYFESGSDVAAGARLVKLRDQDDVAKLATLQAAADLAMTNFVRDQKQLAANLISQAAFDATSANLKSAQAAVAQQAAILDKKTVRAPFAGHLGIRAVNVGQYINPGTTIVTLQALDPIDFDFHLPQQILEKLHVGQAIAVKVDAFPQATFAGKIAAIDPKVDPATRNVAIRAALNNSDHKLLPGMYATAEIETGAPQRFITLPQSAVTYNPYGNTVYVLVDKTVDGKRQRIAQQTFITTGATRGDQIAVLSGVKEGDEVITAGQIKIQNGAAVAVNNAIQPSNEPNPKPVER